MAECISLRRVPIGSPEGGVSEEMVHQRLRRRRLERGASHTALAHQCALRVEWLQAMDEGRFSDLPSGIYGRSAVRRYADALGLNSDEVLAACAPLLPLVEDPISALGRLRGLPASHRRIDATAVHVDKLQGRILEEEGSSTPCELPSWRLLAAAAVDAIVVVGLLIAVVTCTVASGIPMSGLGGAATPAFALLTFVLGSCYFVVLGGIVGETVGEHVFGGRSETDGGRPLDLSAVGVRTLNCVLRDAQFIELLGKWLGDKAKKHRGKGKSSFVPFPFSLS
jgi:hypothetical protein